MFVIYLLRAPLVWRSFRYEGKLRGRVLLVIIRIERINRSLKEIHSKTMLVGTVTAVN